MNTKPVEFSFYSSFFFFHLPNHCSILVWSEPHPLSRDPLPPSVVVGRPISAVWGAYAGMSDGLREVCYVHVDVCSVLSMMIIVIFLSFNLDLVCSRSNSPIVIIGRTACMYGMCVSLVFPGTKASPVSVFGLYPAAGLVRLVRFCPMKSKRREGRTVHRWFVIGLRRYLNQEKRRKF